MSIIREVYDFYHYPKFTACPTFEFFQKIK